MYTHLKQPTKISGKTLKELKEEIDNLLQIFQNFIANN